MLERGKGAACKNKIEAIGPSGSKSHGREVFHQKVSEVGGGLQKEKKSRHLVGTGKGGVKGCLGSPGTMRCCKQAPGENPLS